MELLALFAVGFKGVAAVAGIFLVGGGYLGYRYGSKVQASAVSAAKSAASSVSKEANKL